MSDKKFGLIIPKKTDKFKIQAISVFGDQSDEDEKQSNRPKIPQKKVPLKSKIKQETLEDPSIYEYDSIYDEMKAKEAESIVPKEKKNSRYIETLLKAADKRKKEYERRVDKKIQAERENEGDMYKDKEAFVTSSYKKKLQEKEEEEERERRENMLNDMMDITKQKDLSGFYRHFLKQTVGEEKVPEFGARNIKKEVISRENSPNKSSDDDEAKNQDLGNIDEDSDGIEIDSESDESDFKYKKTTGTENIPGKDDDGKGENLRRKNKRNEDSSDKSKSLPPSKKHKSHRKRATSTSSSDSMSSDNEDVVSSKKVPHSSQKNKSLFSRHDSSSAGEKNKSYREKMEKECSKKDKYKNSSADTSSDDEKNNKSCRNKKEKECSKKDKFKNSSSDTKPSNRDNFKPSKNTNDSSNSDSEFSSKDAILSKKRSGSNKMGYKNRSRHDSSSGDDDSKEKESQEQTKNDEAAKKSKSKNIYTKRSVGEIFVSAQARYFQRMALKI